MVGALSIWHHAVGPTAESVNGVDQTVWALGEEQARRGHQVTFLTDGSPGQVQEAEARGIRLLPVHAALQETPPDILHMHSVFIPVQAKLALWARRHSVPYVVSPHGGVAPQVLHRGRLKKGTYSTLIERPRFRGAAAATAVLEAEGRDIRNFIARDRPAVHVVSNAMKPAPADVPLTAAEDVIFLGRMDILNKGIDRLAEFAALMPDVTFGLYGRRAGTPLPALPSNVTPHEPIHGDAKWAVLRSAAAYLQLSRWEAFGLSVFEAMLVGTPPVVSREMYVAPLVEQWGGLAVDASRPQDWTSAIRTLIESRASRVPDDRMAKAAAEEVHPGAVADRLDAVYAAAVRRP